MLQTLKIEPISNYALGCYLHETEAASADFYFPYILFNARGVWPSYYKIKKKKNKKRKKKFIKYKYFHKKIKKNSSWIYH